MHIQIQAKLDRASVANDPQAAFTGVSGEGRNFEARVAGNALLSNNLAAILATAREDAFYARVLFLFLGAPGAAAAILLTVAVAHSGATRRRRDQSLLRIRGASPGLLLKLATAEALLIAVAGSTIGIVVGAIASRLLLSQSLISLRHVGWFSVAALIGTISALAAVLLPAWWDARDLTIVSARSTSDNRGQPWWLSAYLDVVCLALADSSSGRQQHRATRLCSPPKASPPSPSTRHSCRRSASGSGWAFWGSG